MRGTGESGFNFGGIAIVVIQCDIVRDVIVKLRRARFCRFLGISNRRQWIDVHHHRFGSIARLRQRFGDHERHRIADITHLVGHQSGAVGLQQRRAIAVLQRQAAGEGAIIGLGQICTGPDPEHARHFLCR